MSLCFEHVPICAAAGQPTEALQVCASDLLVAMLPHRRLLVNMGLCVDRCSRSHHAREATLLTAAHTAT